MSTFRNRYQQLLKRDGVQDMTPEQRQAWLLGRMARAAGLSLDAGIIPKWQAMTPDQVQASNDVRKQAGLDTGFVSWVKAGCRVPSDAEVAAWKEQDRLKRAAAGASVSDLAAMLMQSVRSQQAQLPAAQPPQVTCRWCKHLGPASDLYCHWCGAPRQISG